MKGNKLYKDRLGDIVPGGPKKVYIAWLDASMAPFDNINPQAEWTRSFGVVNETMGFLLSKDEKFVAIAYERCNSGGESFRHRMDIPTCNVLRMVEVRV